MFNKCVVFTAGILLFCMLCIYRPGSVLRGGSRQVGRSTLAALAQGQATAWLQFLTTKWQVLIVVVSPFSIRHLPLVFRLK